MSQQSSSGSKQDYTFGQVAIRENICSFEQVKECLDIQAKLRGLGIEPKKLGEILIEKGYLTPEQAIQVAKAQTQTQNAAAQKLAIPGYEILGKIGQGAMGAVYKGRQVSMDRVVAIKILTGQYANDRSFIERFHREARAVAKLNHENIISGIDVGEAGGIHYFVMEFVDGVPVHSIMRREGRLAERRCLEIALQVAKALSHAHRHGIVHRDVKPENIMITADKVAKLCDLGLAKQMKGDAGATMDGLSLGTPNYISPEQARGEELIDTRSDIYSLGASLYHMATGTTPFSGANPMVVMTKHVTEWAEPPKKRLPALSEGYSNLVMKMMQKRREDRPQDPEALIAEIETLLRGGTVSAPATRAGSAPAAVPPVLRARPPSTARVLARERKSPMVPVLAAGGVVAAIVIGIVALSGGGDPYTPSSSSNRGPLPPPDPNPSSGPGPESVDPLEAARAELKHFHDLVEGDLAKGQRPDRISRPYAQIQDRIAAYQKASNFAALKVWRNEHDRFQEDVNRRIEDGVWKPIRERAKGHADAGRYRQALDELKQLEDVYRWFKPGEVATAAGREHGELVKSIQQAMLEAFGTGLASAKQAFRQPARRGEAYGMLDALADSLPERKPDVERERALFFEEEVREVLGQAPSPATEKKAEERIAELKKIHQGNPAAAAALDGMAKGLRDRQLAIAAEAGNKARSAVESGFRPRFEAALKQRDLAAARKQLQWICLAPENLPLQSTLFPAPGFDVALLRAWLDPARPASFADSKKVLALADQGVAFALKYPNPTARDLYVDLRAAILLEDLLEQAVEGARAVSRDAGKFKSGFSPVLRDALAADAAPRKAGDPLALALTMAAGGASKLPALVSPRGAPAISLTEDDIVKLASRAAGASGDPNFPLKAFLLNIWAENLRAAKSWWEKMPAAEARAGLERFAPRLEGVLSEAAELEAKALFEQAWDLFHKKKDPVGGKKRFLECVEKFGATDYMKEKVSTLGKSRIDVVQGMFGSAAVPGSGSGGGGGGGTPARKALQDLFATADVRELGRYRYEATYTFKEDREFGIFVVGDGNVNVGRGPAGSGAQVAGQGIWYWNVPLRGNVTVEASFRMANGPFGMVLHGEKASAGYLGIVDLPLPGLGPQDLIAKLPLEPQNILQNLVAQGAQNLAAAPGAPSTATFTRDGTKVRLVVNGNRLEGDNVELAGGRAGLGLVQAGLLLDKIKFTADVERSWIDSELPKFEGQK